MTSPPPDRERVAARPELLGGLAAATLLGVAGLLWWLVVPAPAPDLSEPLLRDVVARPPAIADSVAAADTADADEQTTPAAPVVSVTIAIDGQDMPPHEGAADEAIPVFPAGREGRLRFALVLDDPRPVEASRFAILPSASSQPGVHTRQTYVPLQAVARAGADYATDRIGQHTVRPTDDGVEYANEYVVALPDTPGTYGLALSYWDKASVDPNTGMHPVAFAGDFVFRVE